MESDGARERRGGAKVEVKRGAKGADRLAAELAAADARGVASTASGLEQERWRVCEPNVEMASRSRVRSRPISSRR